MDRRKSKNDSSGKILFFLLLILIIGAAILIIDYNRSIGSPNSQDDEKVVLEITEGESVEDIYKVF